MYDTLRRYVYWPTMVVDVYKHVEQCPACAKNRLSERRHTSTTGVVRIPFLCSNQIYSIAYMGRTNLDMPIFVASGYG